MLESDGAEAVFVFASRTLVLGRPQRFFLIAGRPVSDEGAEVSIILWPGLLLWVLGAFGLSRARLIRQGGKAALYLFLVGLPLLTFACSSGGGGSRAASSPPSTEVRFSLLEITTHGDKTGVSGTSSGLPLSGPPLVL